MTWLAIARTIYELPTPLAQLDALAALDAALTIDDVLAVIAEDHDELVDDRLWQIAADVARVCIPADRWVALYAAILGGDVTQARYTVELALPHALGPRAVAPALAALEEHPVAALRLLAGAWPDDAAAPPELAGAWPRITALAGHRDPAVARAVTLLALRGRQVVAPMIDVLARELAQAVSERDPAAYDDQVDVEELLWQIARTGPALREVAPALVPLLRSDAMAWRVAATTATAGIGASALRPVLEATRGRLKTRRASREKTYESAHLDYAIWTLGGPPEALARAAAAAADDLVLLHRISFAMEVTPVDDRLIAALRGIADDARWTATICQRFAALGPRAAAAVATLPAQAPDAEAYTPWVEARYRCGLATRDETRRALEAHLAWHAWSLYVELAVVDPVAEQRVREELSAPPSDPIQPCVPHLTAQPALAARLVPLLRANGYADVLYALWRQGVAM